MPLYSRRWVPSTEDHEELHIWTRLDLLNEETLCLPDAVIFRDLALCYDCLESWKMANENDDHIKLKCLDQNARESAVQSMYGVNCEVRSASASCWLHTVLISTTWMTCLTVVPLYVAVIIFPNTTVASLTLRDTWTVPSCWCYREEIRREFLESPHLG